MVNTWLSTTIDSSCQTLFVPNLRGCALEVERCSCDGLNLSSWDRGGTHGEHIRTTELKLVISNGCLCEVTTQVPVRMVSQIDGSLSFFVGSDCVPGHDQLVSRVN